VPFFARGDDDDVFEDEDYTVVYRSTPHPITCGGMTITIAKVNN
jgi:hypothetical protein